jgi:type VI secretion system secreted protein VgrG
MAYTQVNRAMQIFTPLDENVLLLTGLRGAEGISRPFRFDLDLISSQRDIGFDQIVGKSVTISIILPGGSTRSINGIVTRFAKADAGVSSPDAKVSYPYGATIQPAFWLLSLTGDCKIFQNLSVPDIVESILGEHGITYKTDLGSYAKREYCVQYNESDFTFISRILEEEGIFYYFEHGNGSHTLVLVDQNSKIPPCPNLAIANYRLNVSGTTDEDLIISLDSEQRVGPTRFALEDFNFKTPNTDLEAKAPAAQKLTDKDLEIYCYPGYYDTKPEAMRLVDMRMEEEEAHGAEITGSSHCKALQSGYQFVLKDYYRESMNDKSYLVTAVWHTVSQSFEEGAGFEYTNSFSCIPIAVKFRPLRTTHKPVMQGAQTAIVVGPPGEEIYTDEYGRIKVQFHWDRIGKKDDKSSCWIRVSQPWAGPGWGAMTIPRINQEVVVDFLEGDPDRPLITGTVYNGLNKPPYPLPDEKTKSTLKSDSSKGGGGFNEIRFEDKKGSEEIYVHAEKDYNTYVKNNTTHTTVKTHTIKADEIFVQGTTKVVIQGANSTITLDASGITIQGTPLVKINP